MKLLTQQQLLTTPSGNNVRIMGVADKKYIPLRDVIKALGYSSFSITDSLFAMALKKYHDAIQIDNIGAYRKRSGYAKGYVIKLEKVVPALETFCRLTLTVTETENLKIRHDENRFLAQQLIETLNREVFHKNNCNPNLEIDEDLFDDVTMGRGLNYKDATHEARVMLKMLADEAGEDEHGINNLQYAIGSFCDDYYDEFCMTLKGEYDFFTLEELTQNLRDILTRFKEDIQMENKGEESISVFTIKDIEDIGERSAAVVKVYGSSTKDALRAITLLKAQELNRDLSPLVELLK